MAEIIRSSEWAMSLEGQGKIVQGLDAIKQRIFILLMTQKGTDPFRYRFGIDILKWVDKPVNKALPGLKAEILDALTEFMPEITVTKITGVLEGQSKVNYIVYFRITNSVKTEQIDVVYGLSSNT
jgi:phage baseplate assembly protein W